MANNQELLEQLELVDVSYEDNNQKAVLTFLDDSKGEIREVNFNRQKYDDASKKFVPDSKKAAEVDEWCKEYFNCAFEELAQNIGERKDVYCYDRFNSLWEVKMITKFEEDMLGQIITTECVHAEDDGKKISIQFEYDGNLYESKMQYADYLDARKEWFINPQKRKKQYEKFEEKFGMLVGEIENMIGKEIMVEVKQAMGKWIYSEVKPFPKPKKKAANK
jgi:hypothetical protein